MTTKTREDLHRPSLLDPSEYEFVAPFYQGSNDDMYRAYAEDMKDYGRAYDEGPVFSGNHAAKGTCDHCGAAFAHGVLFRHTPTTELIHVGHICAANTVGLPSRAAAAKKAAEKFSKDEKERRERFKISQQWQVENADLYDWLFEGEHGHPFLNDMQRTLRKYGNLTPNQTTATRKWMVTDQERKARFAAQQAERNEKLADTGPLVEGRVQMTGKIISTKWKESQFGTQLKMLVELDDGNRVWGTLPESLWRNDPDTGSTHADKGDTVSFTATVERSKDDEHFGFFKRPTGGTLIEEGTE